MKPAPRSKPCWLLPTAWGLALCASTVGCANVNRTAQRSDGLLDFVWSLTVRPRRDVVPVEVRSGRAGEILTAHAEATSSRAMYVSGTLKNGFGYGDIFDAHIDVEVFDPARKLVAATATDYSPRPIPNDYHGTPGRASFGIELPSVPAAGSRVRVVYHQIALADCKISRAQPVPEP